MATALVSSLTTQTQINYLRNLGTENWPKIALTWLVVMQLVLNFSRFILSTRNDRVQVVVLSPCTQHIAHYYSDTD